MRLIAALLFALQSAAFAGGGSSTIDPTQPAFGSGLTSAVIRNQFQAAINDINALIKNNSGTAAPTSPALGQMWLNTSVNPYLLQQYDGSMWVTVGSVNPATHAFVIDGAQIGTGVVGATNGGSGEAGTITGALKGNGASAYTQAACADLSNAGAACQVNTGTSGHTLGFLDGNNTSSGNQTHSGTENFTGIFEIGGTAVTLPVPVAIGGTGSANVSDSLQTFSGVLNASACGKAQTPAWCSGSDIGAWTMAAYAYGHGQAWSQTKVIMDMTSTYNQSTQITKSASDILDCQGSNLIWQSTSGVAFAAGAVGGAVSKIGGNYNCNLTTAGGYSVGHTNVAIYSGGDPAGVINGVDAIDANDIFFNFRVTGFKTPFTHGNNSWSSNLMFPSFSGNFYGIYGTPVLQGTVTAFAISSNVVTVTISNSFTVGDVINITGLTTGTYLNKVPLVIVTRSGSQFTASFTHADVSLVSDSGTAFDGYYNGGEPSTVYGGSISNNTDCGLDLNYTPDQWNVIATHLDYNTVAAACGASPNVDFTSAYIEQLQAPMVMHTGSSGTAIFRFDGGAQTATGAGTDNGFVTLTSVNDIAPVRSVLFSSNHAVSYIVYTGALTGNAITVENPMYEPGSTVGNSTPLTDGISFFSKYSGGILIPSNSAIPLRAETFAAVGEHIDAPSLGTGSYFCNQLGLQLSTTANPNGQWCYYHGTGTGADTDKASLGMFGRNGVITADGAGVVGFDNSNLSASSMFFLDANKHLTNTAPTQTANTVYAGPTSGGAAASAFRALVGADLPNPSASTLGGVESLAIVSHDFLTGISTSGVPSQAQPAFTDVSGVATCAQLLECPIGQAHIPFVLPSSGTMANNGALTVTTALPVTPANAYVYMPANAISSGSTAGWYYAVFSSTTAATLYNNTYTSGTPAIPGSPTAFSTTGPGAYTQTTGAITMYQLSVAGNSIGVNDTIRVSGSFNYANSANGKTLAYKFGTVGSGSNFQSVTPTTTLSDYLLGGFSPQGVTGSQMPLNLNGVVGATGNSLTPISIDTTQAQSIYVGIAMANAADYVILQSIVVQQIRGVP